MAEDRKVLVRINKFTRENITMMYIKTRFVIEKYMYKFMLLIFILIITNFI